jgi:hypothetical protein
VGKLKPIELTYWLNEAKMCEDRMKYDLVKRNNYPFLINYYEGIEKVNPTSPYLSTAEVYAIINEYFANTNSIISEIMFQNPEILTEATKPDAAGNEKLMKGALTYAFDKSDAIVENRVALFDMLFAGYCAVEVGHIIGEEENPFAPSEEEYNGRQTFLEKTAEKLKELFSTEDVERSEAEQAPEKEEAYATTEKTYIRRWSPLSVPLDYKADVLKDRRYNLKKIWLTKAEFDAKYPDYKKEVFPSEKDEYDTQKFSYQADLNKILLYEFQIRRKENEYFNLIIAPCYKKSEIEYVKRPYPTNGFNMKIGTLHKYGKLYPISFAQVNKKINDEMNEYIRFMMNVAEHNIPKFKATDGLKSDGESALRSTTINDIVKVEKMSDLEPMQPTNISVENKELIAIFRQQKEKGWAVSDTRLTGKGNAEFATELNIQEAGFQARQIDIQEGLKDLIKQEVETLKDLVVTYWDGEYFFKVTGGQKPEWYVPQTVINPMNGKPLVLNALTDILTADYEIKIDISTALRPNKEQRKKEMIEFLTWLTSPVVQQYLMNQGKTINIDEFKKAGDQFGFNGETLLIDLAPAPMGPEGAVMPPEGVMLPEGAPIA